MIPFVCNVQGSQNYRKEKQDHDCQWEEEREEGAVVRWVQSFSSVGGKSSADGCWEWLSNSVKVLNITEQYT